MNPGSPPSPRIAIGGFMHETNTFAPTKADLAAFEHGGGWPALAEGEALFEATAGVNLGLAGFIEAGRARDWTLVPTIWCAASPSAHVTEHAFETLAGRLLAAIERALPLDAVFLDLHGAMVTEHLDDGEGELLARVRALVGDNVPIAASLDLHGNVSARMVEAADCLVAYRTYPHVDMARTGARAADRMSELLAGERYGKAFRQIPFLIPIAWQCTEMEPNASLYRAVAEAETGPVVSTSFLCGFPAADIPDCGPSVLAYARTAEAAKAAADDLAMRIEAARAGFMGEAFEPLDAVERAMAISREAIAKGAARPVVIADTQDNPGAGGDSDTTGMLSALVEAGAQDAAIGVIVDPQAALRAHEAGIGAKIEIALGGSPKVAGDAPFLGRFTVEALSDGQLRTKGPYYGDARMDLGPSACLRIGGVRVIVASKKAQLADREMFRFLGIVPEEAAILVVKSSVHFRADFSPIAEAILTATAPGPMPLSPASLPFTRLRPGIALAPEAPAEQTASDAAR
ncbi:M81 family peptidase [Fulvimarina endophytica]|uniref:Microcystinase C n=2 Tax=Fulvimarina endophytica TaxID=2293836 RepID=A0A371X5M5_9HYPH|nr:M81 family peptidase [Fulvimarina endophytica]